MIQNILNNLYTTLRPMALFLIIIIVWGLYVMLIGKFDITKKRTMYLGLFIGMKDTKLITVSLLLIRLFYIIYAVIIANQNILNVLLVIIITDIIYIILNPRKILFEPINVSAQIILIYFIHVLRSYPVDIANQRNLQYIVIFLSVFVVIYAIYCFLKGFEDILIRRKRRKESKIWKKV